MTGKTFSLNDHEIGFALDHVQDLLRHEFRDTGVPARVRGTSTLTGGRAELEGEIVSVINRTTPGKFVRALVMDTHAGLFTIGGSRAVKEDIAAETVTLLR